MSLSLIKYIQTYMTVETRSGKKGMIGVDDHDKLFLNKCNY